MKYVLVFACLTALLALPARARDETTKPSPDATPKPARKLFFFLPGGKKNAPTPSPAPAAPVEKATPKPAEKPTPKPAPKPTPKSASHSTPKPLARATPKPEPSPEAKAAPAAEPGAAPDSEPKAEDKLKSKFIEPPAPATPTPKPATPAPTPAARARATPAPLKIPALTSTKATPAAIPSPALEALASPAIITSTVPPEPAQIVRAFFGLLGKNDIDAAYAGLMKGSKIGERPEEVRTLKNKTKEAIELFGTVHGYDLVDLKPVGERLMRATYLSLGHELPLRWRFYFYKAEAEWKLIDLRVDDKLTGIFDESPEDNPRPSDTRP